MSFFLGGMALGWSLTPPTVPQCDLECHQLQGSGKEVVGRNKIDAEDHDLSVSFDHCNTLIMLITAHRFVRSLRKHLVV